MREIPLTKGKFAIVDDADFAAVSQYKWHFSRGYAVATPSRRGKHIFMHRLILNPPLGFQTDHVDGNGLNNRRQNLRVATCRQNQQNGRKRILMSGRPTSSRYKGVHWHKRDKRWHVRIRDNSGRRMWLGAFEFEDDARRAYQEAALRIHGKFARV